MSTSGAALATQVDELLRSRIKNPQSPTQDEVYRLVYEIEVYKSELEQQNEELRKTQRHLEAYRDRYIDLYDFAPLGYATLDEDGYLQEINLAGAKMLGAERESLTGFPFGDYVAQEDRQVFLDHVRQCARERREATSELRLVTKGDQTIAVQLRSIPIHGLKDETLCKTAITDITQRRNMEEALRQSQAFLQTVIDAIPDTMLVIGRDYRILLANRAAREMTAGTDFTTCPTCHQISHHRKALCEGQNDPCPLRQVIATKAPMTVLHTHYDAQGNEVVVEISAAPIFDTMGEVTGIIEACRDITERKRAEAALEQERNLLRTLLDNLPDYIYVKDTQSRFMAANAAAARIMGATTPDELLGKTDYDFYPQELASEYRADEERLVRSGQPLINKDEPHRDLYGNAKVVLTTKVPLKDRQQEVIGLVGISRDITDRKLAEEALRKSEERLRVAQQAANSGIWDWDLTTDQCVLSEECFHLWGLEPQAGPVVYDWFAMMHPDDRDRTSDILRATVEGDQPLIGEYRIVRPDGEVRWLTTRGSVVARDASGRATRLSGITLDITERKCMEAELHQAKADAEAANRVKDHFLAVLSHELRMPLTPIEMAVSMLQDRPDLDLAVRETLDMIRRNIAVEVRLIDDLLDVTSIVHGKIELRKQAADLCTVIQGAVGVCQADIETRGLRFGVDVGVGSPYWIEADVLRLQQVFWNLLRNAIKFTPCGGCVGFRCRPDNGYVTVEVIDSGIGIEPEALSRIFNAFEQAEQSIRRQFGGLGLGLAISKTLVEMHGGTISAHSEGLGKGATFRVRLPLTVPASQPGSPVPAAPVERHVRPLHILLVEDHGMTAKLMRWVLTEDGHEVKIAGDVATALQLADENTFDLIISDLGLPDGSGHDLMRRLRERGHTFPGIALSGYGQREDVQRSHEAGFAAHLTKPASREGILETVAAVTTGQ